MIIKIMVKTSVIILVVLCCVNEPIDVSVHTGLYPTYSWNGGQAYSLRVLGDSAVVWAIYTPNQNKLVSPILHGKKPSNAELLLDPKIVGPVDTAAYDKGLVHGEKYNVLIMRTGSYSLGEFDFIADTTKD